MVVVALPGPLIEMTRQQVISYANDSLHPELVRTTLTTTRSTILLAQIRAAAIFHEYTGLDDDAFVVLCAATFDDSRLPPTSDGVIKRHVYYRQLAALGTILKLHPPFARLVDSGVFSPSALTRSVRQMTFEHFEWAAKAVDRLGGKSAVGRLNGALLKSLASMEWDGASPVTIPDKQKRVSETDIKQLLQSKSKKDGPSALTAAACSLPPPPPPPPSSSSSSSSSAAAAASYAGVRVPRVWQLYVTRELWSAIDRGAKTVEGRTNHRTIQSNDVLRLLPLKQSPTDDQPALYRRAVHVVVYRSFFEMIASEGHSKLIPGSESPTDALKVYADLYCAKSKSDVFTALKQKEAAKGVMAIRMAPLSAAELAAARESKAEPEVCDEDQRSATSSVVGACTAVASPAAAAAVSVGSDSSSRSAAAAPRARSERNHATAAVGVGVDSSSRSAAAAPYARSKRNHATAAVSVGSDSSSRSAAAVPRARSKRNHAVDDTDTDEGEQNAAATSNTRSDGNERKSKYSASSKRLRTGSKPKRQSRRTTPAAATAASALPVDDDESSADEEDRIYEQYNASVRQKWKKRAAAAAAAASSSTTASQSSSSSSLAAAAAAAVWADAINVLDLKAGHHLVFMPAIRESIMQRGSILVDISPQFHPSLAYDPPLTGYAKLFCDKLRTVSTPLLAVNPNELTHSEQKFASAYRAAMKEHPPLDELEFRVALAKLPAIDPDATITVQYMHDLNFDAWSDTDTSRSHPLSPHLVTNSRQSLLSVLPPEFRHRFEGVATPYAYLKLPNSFFAIHWEQLFFPSFNRQEEGESEWNVIAPEDNELLLSALRLWVREYHADAKSISAEESDLLDCFFLAKQVMPTVEWLIQHGVPVQRYHQKRHHCIVLRGDAAHFGRGLSTMCLNEAINYVDLDWLSYGPAKCRDLLLYFKRIANQKPKPAYLSDHVMARMLNLIPNGWSANFLTRLADDIDAYLSNRTSIVDYGLIPDEQLNAHSSTLRECIELLGDLHSLYEQFPAAANE